MNRITREEEDGRKYGVLTTEGTDSETFINKERLVGKQKSLENNDQISVVESSLTVFVYFDPYSNSQDKYPKELREEYVILNTLGTGASGEVTLAMSHQHSTPRAIKRLDTAECDEKKKQLDREIEALQRLKHSCIIQLYGVVKCDKHVYLIMEYASGGELPRERLSETVRLV